MKFIELIGWLALIVGGGYLLLLYYYYKEESREERDELIANNSKCKDLTDRYNRSVVIGKPIMTHNELNKKLHQIIKDPKEVQEAIESMERNKKVDEERKLENRTMRKIGYKYEIEIFEIFDTNRELSEQELLRETKFRFNINEVQAKELLELWADNHLIKKCSWNRKVFEIGNTLTDENLSIDETDLTRSKWLKKHGKTLKPLSKECREFLDIYDFPF